MQKQSKNWPGVQYPLKEMWIRYRSWEKCELSYDNKSPKLGQGEEKKKKKKKKETSSLNRQQLPVIPFIRYIL